MEGQQSLLAVPTAPQAVVEFLSGFAARFAFGEAPTAEQRRHARAAAETFAVGIAAMRYAAERVGYP